MNLKKILILKKKNSKKFRTHFMWILKIGGSWIKNRHLDELICKLVKFKNERIIIVTGGGCMADSVREIFKATKMEECTGNFLALKATEIFGHLICQKSQHFATSESFNFVDDKLTIWLPSKKLQNEPTFEKNWNSTSDSVAMWLGKKLNSKGVIILKSLAFGLEKEYELKKLQKENILDKNIHKYFTKKNLLKIAGPEILKYLALYNCWEKLASKCGKVVSN